MTYSERFQGRISQEVVVLGRILGCVDRSQIVPEIVWVTLAPAHPSGAAR